MDREIDFPHWSSRVILERVVNENGVPILDLPKKPVGFTGGYDGREKEDCKIGHWS